MSKPFNIANKLANMMNGSKPKGGGGTTTGNPRNGTFQQIGKKLAVKPAAAAAIRKGMAGKG